MTFTWILSCTNATLHTKALNFVLQVSIMMIIKSCVQLALLTVKNFAILKL